MITTIFVAVLLFTGKFANAIKSGNSSWWGDDTNAGNIVASVIACAFQLDSKPSDNTISDFVAIAVQKLIDSFDDERRRRLSGISESQFELISSEWDDPTFSMDIAFYTADEDQADTMGEVAESEDFEDDFVEACEDDLGITVSDFESEAATVELTTTDTPIDCKKSKNKNKNYCSGNGVGSYSVIAAFFIMSLALIFQ